MDTLNIKFNINDLIDFKQSYNQFAEFLLRSNIPYKLRDNMLTIKEEDTVLNFIRGTFLGYSLYEDDEYNDTTDFIDLDQYEFDDDDLESYEIDEEIEELLENFE